MVKVRGRNSNEKAVKQTAKKEMARASVCQDVGGATSLSCKVMQAIWNVHDQPESLHSQPAHIKPDAPGRFQDHSTALNLTFGTSDVITAVSSSHEIFWPFSAICLTVFLFEFWPRTFTIELYEKKSERSESMVLECSCPSLKYTILQTGKGCHIQEVTRKVCSLAVWDDYRQNWPLSFNH